MFRHIKDDKHRVSWATLFPTRRHLPRLRASHCPAPPLTASPTAATPLPFPGAYFSLHCHPLRVCQRAIKFAAVRHPCWRAATCGGARAAGVETAALVRTFRHRATLPATDVTPPRMNGERAPNAYPRAYSTSWTFMGRDAPSGMPLGMTSVRLSYSTLATWPRDSPAPTCPIFPPPRVGVGGRTRGGRRTTSPHTYLPPHRARGRPVRPHPPLLFMPGRSCSTFHFGPWFFSNISAWGICAGHGVRAVTLTNHTFAADAAPAGLRGLLSRHVAADLVPPMVVPRRSGCAAFPLVGMTPPSLSAAPFTCASTHTAHATCLHAKLGTLRRGSSRPLIPSLQPAAVWTGRLPPPPHSPTGSERREEENEF